MLIRLIILFTVIPLIELALLIKIGSHIGVFHTLFIVVFTGVLGASLAKVQGIRTWYEIQQRLSIGEMPTKQMLDGFLILISGFLLITPGFLTDAVGFLLLVPYSRNYFIKLCINKLKAKMQNGEIRINNINFN